MLIPLAITMQIVSCLSAFIKHDEGQGKDHVQVRVDIVCLFLFRQIIKSG